MDSSSSNLYPGETYGNAYDEGLDPNCFSFATSMVREISASSSVSSVNTYPTSFDVGSDPFGYGTSPHTELTGHDDQGWMAYNGTYQENTYYPVEAQLTTLGSAENYGSHPLENDPSFPEYDMSSNLDASAPAPGRSMKGPETDKKTSSQQQNGYVCLVPGTACKSFKRKADLQRHYRHVHGRSPEYCCDHEKCARHRDPFTRHDHLREHYRDYHKEDLISRASTSKHAQAEFYKKDLRISKAWWRCGKCLQRNLVKVQGWSCSGCKTVCDPERQKLRAG